MSDTSPTPIPTAVSDSSPTAPVTDAPSAPAEAVPEQPPQGDATPAQPDPAPAPEQAAPEAQAAQAPAPVEPPPPADSGATAGAEVPPEGGAAPPEAASPEPSPAPVPVTESTPATGNEVTSPVVDSPAAAVAVLGSDAGVHEGQSLLADVEHAVSHPLDLLQRIRGKLAAYGEECLAAVREEIEALQKHHGG